MPGAAEVVAGETAGTNAERFSESARDGQADGRTAEGRTADGRIAGGADGDPLRVADLAGSEPGLLAVSGAIGRVLAAALSARRPEGPLPPGQPAEVMAAARAALGPARVPARGIGPDAALRQVTTTVVEHGVDLTHPAAAAHLQPPPLTVAVAADTLASLGNASVDTYDSGPSAIAVEQWVIGALARLAGLDPERAAGVLTPGGSLSNLTALQLARENAARRRGVDVRADGVAALGRPVVLCSELAHFSVHRACATLGLGEAAVRPIPVDERFRLRPDALAAALADIAGDPDAVPVAVVATAGSTDFGSIDPLVEIAEIAQREGVWLHVDAAYGFGGLFSDRFAERLTGLELADSITVDLHKFGWLPAAASAVLVSDSAAFSALERSVDYLNPADDDAEGYGGLLGRSLQTTRRPDAVKIAATLLAYGRNGIGAMVDRCHRLASYAGTCVSTSDELRLIAPVRLTTVLFQYVPPNEDEAGTSNDEINAINAELRRALLASGDALIGRTTLRRPGEEPMTCLKLTLMNPTATEADIDALLRLIIETGAETAKRVNSDGPNSPGQLNSGQLNSGSLNSTGSGQLNSEEAP